MRGIRQLGFSYLTYPSAEHTRFIHSLGMYCVVSRFLDTIARRQEQGGGTDGVYKIWTPKHEANLLRHAAILHDVGHLPFSHVTEQIIQHDPTSFRCGRISADAFVFAAEDILETKPKLAEALSVAIVLTDRFHHFYQNCIDRKEAESQCLRIAALIAGLEPDPGLTGLASLISGPSIDADKIDYINRDALACGIPVGVDVSRLFLRSSFLEVTPAELRRMRSATVDPPRSEVVFVVNSSGLDSIEEIGQARTVLYHRVYLHQTTRNAERLLGKAVQEVVLDPNRTAQKTEMRDVAKLWAMNDANLLEQLSTGRNASAARIARRLLTRRLPKRACVFGRTYITSAVPIDDLFPRMDQGAKKSLSKQILGTALEELRARKLRGKAQRDIENLILQEALALAELLGPDVTKIATGQRPEVVSILPMSNVEPNRSDCIILENDRLNSTAASSVSDEQMEAMDIVKSTGYVLTDPIWRSLVCIATQRVFYEHGRTEANVTLVPFPGIEFTVRARSRLLLDQVAVRSKVQLDKAEIDKLTRSAVRKNYFDPTPRLAPLDVDEGAIAQIASTLASFNGQGGWTVSSNTVKSYIVQFPPRHRGEMVKLLQKFYVLDRSELSPVIAGLIRQVDLGAGRGFVVPMSPDSGSAVRTQIEQDLSSNFAGGKFQFCKTIRDAFQVAKPGDTLILCDDNITSGSQAFCQFQAWLGIERVRWAKELRRERGIENTALVERDIELLKQINIQIVTAAGTDVANEFLSTRMTKLGLRFNGARFGRTLSMVSHSLGDLEGFLRGVGEQLVAWTRFNADGLPTLSSAQLSECKRDALGYRGAMALACTPLNVPTGTITALWSPGFYNGEPWVPLLIRRGYLEKLVVG
ncbi:HD domain-containing protein [Mesorhizobium sp. C416B]|nr:MULTISPECIES: HD domain-containing protein [unclassified Mesorhizobium]